MQNWIEMHLINYNQTPSEPQTRDICDTVSDSRCGHETSTIARGQAPNGPDHLQTAIAIQEYWAWKDDVRKIKEIH